MFTHTRNLFPQITLKFTINFLTLHILETTCYNIDSLIKMFLVSPNKYGRSHSYHTDDNIHVSYTNHVTDFRTNYSLTLKN